MHWLEETEIKIREKEEGKRSLKENLAKRENQINRNKNLIAKDYLKFIDEFVKTIKRVNNLPESQKKPFGYLHYKRKSPKIDNLLFSFHSSRKIQLREFQGIFNPFKKVVYKISRNIFISLSKREKEIIVEYKEIKTRRFKKGTDRQKVKIFRFLRSFDPKKGSKLTTFEKKSKLLINQLNTDFILSQIDWLCFKTEIPENELVGN